LGLESNISPRPPEERSCCIGNRGFGPTHSTLKTTGRGVFLGTSRCWSSLRRQRRGIATMG
jgi:hypothetical protein